MVYIPKGEHDNPHELPQQQELEGSTETEHTLYSHTNTISSETNSFQKLDGDAFTFKDKYTALLQQELQNLYWCLHDPITTKSYQISPKMDVETMPHAMYFSGNKETIAKINQVPYQVIEYDNKGM